MSGLISPKYHWREKSLSRRDDGDIFNVRVEVIIVDWLVSGVGEVDISSSFTIKV